MWIMIFDKTQTQNFLIASWENNRFAHADLFV